jgi:hypothetical protein
MTVSTQHKEKIIEGLEARLHREWDRIYRDHGTCNPWRNIPVWAMHNAWMDGWQESAWLLDPPVSDMPTAYLMMLDYQDQVRKLL